MEDNLTIIGPGKDIFSAWFRAKKDLKSTIKPSKTNPHFHSDYITLDSLLKKVDPVCQKHGLGIIQFPTGTGLITILFHEKSGEHIRSYYELILDKQNSQGVGSALTYAKRQVVQAIFGLSSGEDDPEDDDGELASYENEEDYGEEDKEFEKKNPPVKGKVDSKSAFAIVQQSLKEINDLGALETYWKNVPGIHKKKPVVAELFKAKAAQLKMEQSE